jgi:hypothetical protein
MSFLDCFKNSYQCKKQIAERDAVISAFKNHEAAAYGLRDLKVVGEKISTSDIQRQWEGYGVPVSRQHQMGRAWYAPEYVDLWRFLANATAHQKESALDYQCADFSTALMGEKWALALYGVAQIEWHLAVIGVIAGELIAKNGAVGHQWNWARCAGNPKILFIDYLEPAGQFHDINGITKVYVYDPKLHGTLRNADVTW